ncbi:pyridoxamine 5'-phosphate oxidase family protein [Mucilaginibacter agri]|uniref:Pyridoxamine 5'-phosphate oxidase family protein n=1 Tax=Mucilaginibacter agri TaxID=2695265 RepID=A0A965ZMA1_9SPHI|nr:pyridoxamine 5'-phosphate oxidase family protein [Mucilaginibacter agri]NCD72539.1 pyridoxamine 5'-phosphate oxidase family protein [Mucilaginibacter agri]
MLGELNMEMINELLRTQLIGRLGTYADGVVSIVPVNFSYDGAYIYAHSQRGLKINSMRKNPNVCFEVDKIENLFNWQCVVCWGMFEEITDISESEHAMKKIIQSIEPYLSEAENAHPSHGIVDVSSEIGTTTEIIIYKIKVTKKTGRFEYRASS